MKPLSRALARRMAPLALLTALLIGGLLPLLWRQANLESRRAEASTWARHLAAQLEPLAQQNPQLWAYDAARLDDLVEAATRAPLHAAIRLDVPEREAIFEVRQAPLSHAIGGWAPVVVEGQIVGRLQVRLDGGALYRVAHRVTLGALLLALLLGLTLYRLPVRAVTRAEEENLRLWRALSEAKADLERRVEARTAELQKRERDLQRLGARLLEIQEEERARISRDLHDDLGQILTGLRLRLAALEGAVRPEGARHLKAAEEAIDAGVEQVRRIAHDLRPPELDALGLIDALGSHARRWAEAVGLSLSLTLGEEEPPALIAEVLFRIAQEALTNIARHAQARAACLRLDRFDDGWRLIVEDDGRGLPPTAQRSGLGLLGAVERAEGAGGYLDLDQSELGGARLTAWLPEEA
ncbi:sensor histidine kinase [Myxococcota bacterium]|nr:sensor histidine kinase [Myxococcota bacterium]